MASALCGTMMPLAALLQEAGLLEHATLQGDPETPVLGVTAHAQKASRGELFIAIQGTKADGHLMISDAVERGVAAVLVERDIPPYPGVAIVRVPSTREATGPLAQAWLGNPAQHLKTVAVTGTNGKSTTVGLIQDILTHAGRSAGRIGTLGAAWNGKEMDHGITTPDPLVIAREMAAMRADGVECLAIEASSHAIHQARIGGVPLAAAVFTNISQDHLDYHGDFPAYIAVKRNLFVQYLAQTGGVACLNREDPVGEELSFSYAGPKLTTSHRGNPSADVAAEEVRLRPDGTHFILRVGQGAETKRYPVVMRLLGEFNVANALSAAAACLALGLTAEQVALGLCVAEPVRGRFERVAEGQPFTVIVDYAHTPDALEKVLKTARRLTPGRVVTVFGCGGDRDATKRPLMGAMVARYSDYAVLTNDNPRTEDPAQIAAQAMQGLVGAGFKNHQYTVLLDRAEAIERALRLARPGDCVLIAGKGHETYQDVQGRKMPFDDREVARAVLQTMRETWAAGRRGYEAAPSTTEGARRT